MIAREAKPRTEVTVLLPRRSYSSVLGRLLHDRTADRIARLISRVPNATATIIPYDTSAKLAVLQQHQPTDPASAPVTAVLADRPDGSTRTRSAKYAAPEPPADAGPIRDLVSGHACDVQGRVRTVKVGCVGDSPTFMCEIVDSTGDLTVQFYGRRTVAGIEPGRLLRVQGRSLRSGNGYVIANPDYQLLTN